MLSGIADWNLKVTGRGAEPGKERRRRGKRERREKSGQHNSLDSPGSGCVAHSLCYFVRVWKCEWEVFKASPCRRILQSHPALCISSISLSPFPSSHSCCLPFLFLKCDFSNCSMSSPSSQHCSHISLTLSFLLFTKLFPSPSFQRRHLHLSQTWPNTPHLPQPSSTVFLFKARSTSLCLY